MMAFVFPLLIFLASILYLTMAVALFMFLERKLSALVQHRGGQPVSVGAFLSPTSFFSSSQRFDSGEIFSSKIKGTIYFWMALPLIFLFLLFGGPRLGGVLSSLPAVFLIAAFSLVIEVIFLHHCTDELEREGWRSRLGFRFAALFALTVAFWVVALNAGGLSLKQISQWQDNRILPLFFHSPGAFLSSIVAFLSISLLARFDLQDLSSADHLRGRWQRLIFLNKRVWLISFLTLWVFCFWGGGTGILALLTFPLKIVLLALVLIFIQISLPKVRATVLTESYFSIFLKLAMLGVILEVVWMGIFL